MHIDDNRNDPDNEPTEPLRQLKADLPKQHGSPSGEPSLRSEIKPGDLVELVKASAAPNAPVESSSWKDYRFGSGSATHSLPVRYSLKGILLEGPQIGRPVKIYRLERNGIQVDGYYESTPVIRLTADGFVTQNSCYWLRRLEQF